MSGVEEFLLKLAYTLQVVAFFTFMATFLIEMAIGLSGNFGWCGLNSNTRHTKFAFWTHVGFELFELLFHVGQETFLDGHSC